MSDLISRQDAIEAIKSLWNNAPSAQHLSAMFDCEDAIRALSSAESERDIPRKPIEGCSLSWGKKVKEASCPNCNFFLSHYRFYGEGKRITYCEHCGQAIDWEGWDFDE